MPMPPTNLVCADADGNIAFRIAVFAPVRRGWSGRLPVPGTGNYEWGPERRTDLPSEFNPARGYIATANNLTHPPDFAPPYAYVPADRRYRRHERIVQMIEAQKTVHDRRHAPDAARFAQHRGRRAPAASSAAGPATTRPSRRHASRSPTWNAVMDRESAAAAVYMTWRDAADLDAVTQGDRAAMAAALTKALATLDHDAGTRSGDSGGGDG